MSKDRTKKPELDKLRSLANKRFSLRRKTPRAVSALKLREPAPGPTKHFLVQQKTQKRLGAVALKTGSRFIDQTVRAATDADQRQGLVNRASEAVKQGDWKRFQRVLASYRHLAKGIGTDKIQTWIRISERSGRYDVTEYLIEILPESQRQNVWFQQAYKRSRHMNVSPSELPPELRSPELSVIDAVRENDFVALRTVLRKQTDPPNDLVDLAENVNSTLHFVWKRVGQKKHVKLYDIERESALSRQHINYLFRDWTED